MIYVIENTKVDITKDLLVHGQLVSPHMMSTVASRQSLGITDFEAPQVDADFQTVIVLDEHPWYKVVDLDPYQVKTNISVYTYIKQDEAKKQTIFNYSNIHCTLSSEFKVNCLTQLFGPKQETYTNILKKIASYEFVLDEFFDNLRKKIFDATSVDELKSFKYIEVPKIDSDASNINNTYFNIKQRIFELESSQNEIIRNVILNKPNARLQLETLDAEIEALNTTLQSLKG